MGCNAVLYLIPDKARTEEVDMGGRLVRLGYQVPVSSEPLVLIPAGVGRGEVERGWGRGRWLGKGWLGSGGQAGMQALLQARGSGEGWSATLPRTRGRNKSETTGDIVSVQQVLLKWREIYGWHFVTINQELLINKVSSLFSWKLGCYENCQTDHFIHYFWLMHPDSLTLKKKKKEKKNPLHYAKA